MIVGIYTSRNWPSRWVMPYETSFEAYRTPKRVSVDSFPDALAAGADGAIRCTGPRDIFILRRVDMDLS